MDFGEILTRAWKIIWKYKILWLFGILSSCGQGGSGGGGSSGGGGGNTDFEFDGSDLRLPPELQHFFFNIERFLNHIEIWEIVGIIAIFVLAILVFWFVMLALSTIGRVGLIQGTLLGDDDVDSLSFSELFERGKPFFWRVLGLNLLIGLVGLALVLVLILPMVGIGVLTAGLAFLCLLPLICILVPLGWVVGIIILQANIILVVEDVGIIASLERAWHFFRAQWQNLLVMGLILGIGGFVVGLIISLPLILTLFPLIISLVAGTMTESSFALGTGLSITGLLFIGYLPVMILLSGILQAYVNVAWTLTYQRLMDREDVES